MINVKNTLGNCFVSPKSCRAGVQLLEFSCMVFYCLFATRFYSCYLQRIVKMNKTEDDELDAQELTEEELRQISGRNSIANAMIYNYDIKGNETNSMGSPFRF